MERRFKSLSLFEFQEKFPDKDSCLSYLADLKWEEGYSCCKFGHGHYCSGSTPYSRQCTRCRYVESPTAGTLFHKVKFDLVKAFWIVYFVSTNKKKKLVVVGIEKKGKGVSRLYARVIPRADAFHLGGFMKDHIDPNTEVTTDQWTGYNPVFRDYPNMIRTPSGKKGSNFPELHRVIMMLKAWLRGIHHHVDDLQDYLDEYCCRFNRSFMKEKVFDNLMLRMVKAPPCFIKNVSD